MTDHIIDIIWIVGLVLAIYPCSVGAVNLVTDGGKPDTFDKLMGGFFGIIMAILWPIILGGVVAYKLSKFIWLHYFVKDEEREKVDQ